MTTLTSIMNDRQFLVAAYSQFRIQFKGGFAIHYSINSRSASAQMCRDLLYEALSIPLPSDSERYITWPTLNFSAREYETLGDATDAALNQIAEWNEAIQNTFEEHAVADWETTVATSAQYEDFERDIIDNSPFYRLILRSYQVYPADVPAPIDLFNTFSSWLWDSVERSCNVSRIYDLDYDHDLWDEVVTRRRRAQAAIMLQNMQQQMNVLMCLD